MYAKQTFRDPELFRRGIAAASAELVLATGGVFQGSVSRGFASGAHAQRAESSLEQVLVVGVRPRAVILLGMGEGDVSLDGRPLPAGSVALCPPGLKVHVRTGAGAAWNTVSFSTEDFDATGRRMLGGPVDYPTDGTRLAQPSPSPFATLVNLRRTVFRLPAALKNTEVEDALASRLLEAAVACFAGPDDMHEMLGQRRARQIVGAMELLLKGRENDPTPLMEVCTILDVSERTLNRACQNVLGMSTARYMRHRRLHAVRRVLQRGETTVTRAAVGQGFWELGRFAAAYQVVFGERPSETLGCGGQRVQHG